LNELSLFTGIGGGVLASKLTGKRVIGYVEWNEHCQQAIAQRIKDGIFDDAPIFSDINSFISEGYAESYQGLVDVISAGFVCTDVSVANQTADGTDGDRTGATWDSTADCIRIIRPPYVFLENSAAIVVRGIERVADDLSRMGYEFRWGVMGATHTGGIHERRRWWCVATHASCLGLERWYSGETERKISARSIQTLRESEVRVEIPDPESFGDCNDVARRVERLRAIGNGQVPSVAAAAWRILNQ